MKDKIHIVGDYVIQYIESYYSESHCVAVCKEGREIARFKDEKRDKTAGLLISEAVSFANQESLYPDQVAG